MLRKACLLIALTAAVGGAAESGTSRQRLSVCTNKISTHTLMHSPETQNHHRCQPDQERQERSQQGQGGDAVPQWLPLLHV